ncbi:unnamed protein product [Blepharisma stoltei]|uniref:Uncharacterized protein n=1 Tax=Blepharisma stoltei TaxID=1481888 RepID=A0AAU9KA20_9CILI|nr:unnamed protein product [Blepharisma stoltei]
MGENSSKSISFCGDCGKNMIVTEEAFKETWGSFRNELEEKKQQQESNFIEDKKIITGQDQSPIKLIKVSPFVEPKASVENNEQVIDDYMVFLKTLCSPKHKRTMTMPASQSSGQKLNKSRRSDRSPTASSVKEPLHIQVSLSELARKRKVMLKLNEIKNETEIRPQQQIPDLMSNITPDSPSKLLRSFSSNITNKSVNLVEKMRMNTSSIKNDMSVDTFVQDP